MTINFDLISDLYLTTSEDFTWDNKATSLFCIVAGNISSDHSVVYEVLHELVQYYDTVFFIDGDLEHDKCNGDFDASYKELEHGINQIHGVVFLHENIIVMDGATIVATNGWTTFDFTNKNNLDETIEFLELKEEVPARVSNDIFKMAVTDQHYLCNSIETCQTMAEVQNIIIVTNAVPDPNFITHDLEYDGTILGDTAGNNGILQCLEKDDEKKISTWLFAKYKGDLDYNIDGVRYVNNPKRDKDLNIYYPKLIKF